MKRVSMFIRWLYPGLNIKRWVFSFLLGVTIIVFSSPHISQGSSRALRVIYRVIFTIGFLTILMSIVYLVKSFWEVLYPQKEKNLIDIIYEKRYLAKGPKIVALGGGTGLSTLLYGLKEYTANITAIVTVADEGGSSGRLREEFGILPPGDIRNCLVSLAEAPQLMRDLFQYRFQEGNGIKGHSFGNLFITALTQVVGSFKDAVEESSKVLAIRGKVLPSTLEKIRLKAEYMDGSTKEGEDKIPQEKKPIKRLSLMPQTVNSNPQAIEAIKNADLIIIGPGSLFTSILPNLLIKDIADSIVQRTDAVKVYVCNLMTQHGETDGFTAFDHVQKLLEHTSRGVIDSVLVNTGRLEQDLLYKYANEKSFPVIPDISRIKNQGLDVSDGDVVSRVNYLRHDSNKCARIIINRYNLLRRRWKSSVETL